MPFTALLLGTVMVMSSERAKALGLAPLARFSLFGELTPVEQPDPGVFDLVVAPAHRRRGYGRRLLQSMLA